MKYALVTGASSGMGLEYASQLACAGHNIIAVSNQEEQLKAVAADLSGRYGVDVIPLFRDLARSDAADELLRYCDESNLDVDILVSNAGMFFFKELGAADEGRVEAMVNLHVVTTTRLCLLFGSRMKQSGGGRILIMASLAAVLPMPGITVYAATKAYLRSFGQSLYFEMKPYGVSVTTICPAAVATPLYHLKDSLMRLGVRTGVIWTTKRLVKRALRAMEHGRRLVRPGFMNIYLPLLIALLPNPLVAHLWKRLKQ